MKKVIVAVSNKLYVNHTFSLFGNLKLFGGWKGDLVLILSEKIDDEDVRILQKNNVKLLFCEEKNPYYAKLCLFLEYFKNWDKILYLDQDMLVGKDVNPLFEQEGLFLIDQEDFYLKQYFKNNDEAIYNDLQSNYDLNLKGYITCCMLYDSSIIKENTVSDLFKLKEKYHKVNSHCGLDGGTDGSILNLYFIKIFKQIQHVCYQNFINKDTILAHTCHFNAPWINEQHFMYYQQGLNYFRNLGF